MRAILAISVLILLSLIIPAYGSTSGSINEVIGNEDMQIYVVSVKEQEAGEREKQVDIEIILKNLEPNARVFNIFFVKAIDVNGNEYKPSPLISTVMPIRIPSNDVIRGTLTFFVLKDVVFSELIWEEFNGPRFTIDLTNMMDPSDPMLESDWELTANKGRAVSDGRLQFTVHDENLNKDPPYYHVDISIKNLSNDAVSYSASYTFVKDQDGYLYPPDVKNLQLMNKPLRQGQLKQGEEVRGEILFPLPSGVNNVMLIYDEEFGGDSYIAVPEFPYHFLVLIASVGTGLIFARIRRYLRY